ncbi:MAG: histidinol-phosphatase HisJ family protein [Clostridia bacterium]|nr:histidinol-phosphatase HisJ family protein [Clostridia bacterium]
MLNKQNLHVHTVFCDGKNTAEEMVKEAIARGFDSLGFSIHSPRTASLVEFGPERMEAYKTEIKRLKAEYSGKFNIYLGIEEDYYSDNSDPSGFEYSLIAVHALKFGDKIFGFDTSLEKTTAYVNEHFGSDGMAFAKLYYQTLAKVADSYKYDVIAHIDLVTKNNEKGRFFDETSKEYFGYAFEAIDALRGKIPFFEVNTGAVARGYRSTHYPSMPILKRLRELGFGATISTDCHDKNYLDFEYERATEYLKEAGFKSKFILTDNGFLEVGL